MKEEKHCRDLNASGGGLEGVCIPYRCMAHKEHGAKSGGGKREKYTSQHASLMFLLDLPYMVEVLLVFQGQWLRLFFALRLLFPLTNTDIDRVLWTTWP